MSSNGPSKQLLLVKDLRSLCAPDYRFPLLYLGFDWLCIAAAISVSLWLDHAAVYLLAATIIAGRQHALFVMIHEGVHKHVAGSKLRNDLITNWLAAFPNCFDLHYYRLNHLKHHEHLNTEQDPDLVRKRGRKEWEFPTTKLSIALYLPFFVIIWGPIEWAMALVALSGLTRAQTYRDPQLRAILIQKLLFYALAVTVISYFGVWREVALYWFIPMFFIFPLLQRIRSIAEHFGLAWTNDLDSSRDVLPGPLERSVIAPHDVGYHLSHHLYPAVPAYRLKALHQKLMANEGFRSHAHLNRSYIGLGASSVLSDILRAPKGSSADKKVA